MKAALLIVFFSSCLVNLAAAVPANETLKVAAQPIPFFIESEDKGAFIELTQEIAKRLNIKVSIELYPAVRAFENFRLGKSLILLPGNSDKLKGEAYLESEPIYQKKIYIYSLTDERFSELKHLAHKRVGVTMGYANPPELQSVTGVEIQEAHSEEANLRKLHAHRIDAFLGEERSVNDALKSLGYTDITYESSKAISVEPIFYAFQKTPEGQKWLKKFNEAIRLMKKSGTLDKIVLKK